MTPRDDGWRLWARLIESTRREIVSPPWTAIVPRIAPTRPAAAPLLAGATLALSPRLAQRWLERIFGQAAPAPDRHAGQPAPPKLSHTGALSLLEAAVCADDHRLQGLASALGMEASTLASVAHLASLPLLHACARAVEPRVSPAWPYHYCPVCGAWPTSAERRGIERTYRLRCARCGGDWGTALLCCPYCGERDHRRLGALIPASGGESRQVNVCRTCHGYLKVLTTLQRTPSDGLIGDDLETVDLDIAALERGYRRPQRPGYLLTTYVVPQPGRWRAWIGGRVARQRAAEGREDVTPC